MSKSESRFVDFRAIKVAVTMEQVLSHYGVLDRFKRSNDSLSGPCPIHGGTNPTQFRVSISKNCWNCFGDCHGGGNVLDFVVCKESIDPTEAANRMVEWFHLDRSQLNAERDRDARARKSVSVPSTQRKKQGAQSPEGSTGTNPTPSKPSEDNHLNKPLGFRLELDPTHPYLAERGLLDDTIAEFGIGYCQKGVMAGRIAIPICNVMGDLVGYAGRWPGEPPEGRPKYRLPDAFRKSAEVYRLSNALREPADSPLIVVEGFFDVFKLWQLGLRKCVALMGSSLSTVQAALIFDHLPATTRIVVMFDEDDAGREGREHALLQLSLRRHVRLVAFPQEGFQPEQLTPEELKLLQIG